MKAEEIKNGIWTTERLNHINKSTVTELTEYDGSSDLRLYITQLTDRSSYQQSKLVKEWCKTLPTFKSIEHLWLPSSVNQKMFDAICELPNLKTLWIKWSGIKRIEKIERLSKIQHLHIGSSSQIESIQPLAKLNTLITLETEQLNKISNFEFLGVLTQLEGLGIDGSIWGTQKIDSLEFLTNITDLKYFTMSNSRLKTKSFEPLLSLKNLVRFNSSWNYPEKEFEKLKDHPTLKFGNIETSWKELKDQLNNEMKKNGW